MALQDRPAPPSGSDQNSSQPFDQTSIKSWFSRDIKTLISILLAGILIIGVIGEWRWLHRDQAKGPVTPANNLSPLLPFCSPEQDECWR